MKRLLVTAIIVLATLVIARAGDDASGPIKYETDLSPGFSRYMLSEVDRSWSSSLVKNLGYAGEVVHFLKTDIPLHVDGEIITGSIYQAQEKPGFFYVIPSDTMLKLDTKWPYNPGVGGFSMHMPPSRNFIVCLNLAHGGVPHLSGTPVSQGTVTWTGRDWNRFE